MRKTGKKHKVCLAAFLTVLWCMALAGISCADADSAGVTVSIEKPAGWRQGSTTVKILVDDGHLEGVSIRKVEAKVGEDGSWQDVTGSGTVTIDGNTTVYVRVTDSNGAVYEQNRSIRCYDGGKPTLTASLSDGVLTIQGRDDASGVASVTVNGTTYTDLSDGKLVIQLTQKDFTTKKIEITAKDGAGNESDMYSLQNPYYEWAVRQAAQQVAEQSDGFGTPAGTDDGREREAVISPLPQDASPSGPTQARGTVDERTVTGIEEELARTDETLESISQPVVTGGKEFYTISTKSGKVFYLIIDNDRQDNNVYFLTEVGEKDLMNFTLSDTATLPDVEEVYAAVETEEPQTERRVETEPETQPVTELPAQPEPEKSSPAGIYLLIALLAIGALAAGWYRKVYKTKHAFEDDLDEYEGEEGSLSEDGEYEENGDGDRDSWEEDYPGNEEEEE